MSAADAPPSFPITQVNRVKRVHERGRYDRKTVYEILDAALVCHIAYVIDGGDAQRQQGARRGDAALPERRAVEELGAGDARVKRRGGAARGDGELNNKQPAAPAWGVACDKEHARRVKRRAVVRVRPCTNTVSASK